MNPTFALVSAVNARLVDEGFRERIRAMHAKQTPLIEMVDELGLTPEMSREIRAILEGLDAAQVEGIRKATLEMLDRAEQQMPVDCNVSQEDIGRAPVAVSIVDEAGTRTIRVRAT